VPDIVSANDARLVTSGDPPALAAAIAGVLQDRASARARARAARTRLELEFSLDLWLRRYETIYRTVRRRASAARLE
jgi:hypothetical protein